jgi:hypothetical protein
LTFVLLLLYVRKHQDNLYVTDGTAADGETVFAGNGVPSERSDLDKPRMLVYPPLALPAQIAGESQATGSKAFIKERKQHPDWLWPVSPTLQNEKHAS